MTLTSSATPTQSRSPRLADCCKHRLVRRRAGSATELMFVPRDGCRSCGLPQQLRHPDQVVGRRGEHRDQLGRSESHVPRLSIPAHRLYQSEDLLDPLPDALTDRVADRLRRSRVERRVPRLVCDVRRDVSIAARGDEVARVIALVSAERDALLARQEVVDEVECGSSLRMSVARPVAEELPSCSLRATTSGMLVLPDCLSGGFC